MATEAQCDSCGELNASDATFCLICGTYLGWDQRGSEPSTAPVQRPVAAAAPAPPAAPAPETPPVRTAPMPVLGHETPSGGPGREEAPCPACGHANDPSRRFCGRCGATLSAAGPTSGGRGPITAAAAPSSLWSRWLNSEERAARRAYRRSLPATYRVRRGVLTVLLAVLVVCLLAVLAGNPVEWGRQRWYDLTNTTEPLMGITPVAVPDGSVADSYDVSGAVDGSPYTAWARAWPGPGDRNPACGATVRNGAVKLRWDAPVRVRSLDLRAGLRQGTERGQQPRPARVDVIVGSSCRSFDLQDAPGWQPVPFDSHADVKWIVVAIGGVFPPQTTPHHWFVAISDLRVLARPR